ncbi:carbohydrate ABC transporter permease [Paenibacillus sp. MBLB4367]|uniref:carbohydrate ABC transporter permease n=1 Tax=Paenibacillus sp. MBLB4367 TaxID=3384767 RepID=UPI0039083916
MTKHNKLGMFLFEFAVIIMALIVSVPLYLAAINTFKTHKEIVTKPLGLPEFTIGFANIANAFERMDIVRSYSVNMTIAAITLITVVFVSSLAAYSVSRIHHKFMKWMYWFFVSAILLPIESAMIPVVFLLKDFHLQNTLIGISFIYIAIFTPFSVFLYSGFMRGLPFELEESAYMEGSGPARTFFHIIFPLLKPVTATLIIMLFIGMWNDLLLPLVLLNSADNPTVSINLYKFFGSRGMADLSLLFGGITLTLLPTLILFISFQRFFVKGLVAGAIKG